MVVSASFTATQSSVTALKYKIRMTGAGSGSFDRALSTWALDSLTAKDVFTISPKFIWGLGLVYESQNALEVEAGAVLTLSNAAADINVKAKTASNPRNWQPSAQVTYPQLTKPGRVVLSAYTKTDIQLSLTIFGQYMPTAAVLTSQTNIAYDASVLSSAQSFRKRTTDTYVYKSDVGALRERGMFSSLIAQINAVNNPATPSNVCKVGSMRLNTIMKMKYQAVVGGKPTLFNTPDYNFGSKWYDGTRKSVSKILLILFLVFHLLRLRARVAVCPGLHRHQ